MDNKIFSCFMGQYNISCLERISHVQGDFLVSHGTIEYLMYQENISWARRFSHVPIEYLISRENISWTMRFSHVSWDNRMSHGQGDFLVSRGTIEYADFCNLMTAGARCNFNSQMQAGRMLLADIA